MLPWYVGIPTDTPVPRKLLIPAIAFLTCACSGSDAAVGPNSPPGKNPNGSDATRATPIVRIDLGTLGGSSSYAADINNSDVAVGWSETKSGAIHAFRWTPATGMMDLGTLDGDTESRAVAVIDGSMTGGGQVLGLSGRDGNWTPVLWSPSGSITRLPIPRLPNFSFGQPLDFNARGDVVGWDAGAGQHAWAWSTSDGTYDLSANVDGGSNEGWASAVTAAGVVILTTRAFTCHHTVQCWRGYTWTKMSGYTAIGTPESDTEADVVALGTNEAGVLVGWATHGDTTEPFPYRWSPQTGFTTLPNYSSGSDGYGYATAINFSGAAVGGDRDPESGSILASIWVQGEGISRLTPGDPNPSVAVAINDQGTIAGWAVVGDGVTHAVLWSSVLKASRASLTVSAASRRYIPSPSVECLKGVSAALSRQALFACAVIADRNR